MPVILYVGKEGCGACSQFENQVWHQIQADRSLTERFTFREIKRIEPAWDRHVQGFPTVLGIDTNSWNQWFGSKFSRQDTIPAIKYNGPRTPEAFRSWLFSLRIL